MAIFDFHRETGQAYFDTQTAVSGEPELTVSGAEHGHTLEAVTLSTAVTLSIASMSHAHTIDAPTLSADMALAVAGMEHSHTIDNVDLDTAASLTVADLEHSHTVESPTLSADMGLVVAGVEHALAIENVVLTGSGDDPYWDDVALLLHMDGANDSTTFIDETGKTVTPVGNAKISTAVTLVEAQAGLFVSSGDRLSVPDSAGLELAANDFTLEATVRFTGYAYNYSGAYAAVLIGKDQVGARAYHWKIAGTASSYDSIVFSTAGAEVSVSYSFALNTTYRVAVSKNGTSMRFFVEGTQAGATQTHSTTIADVAAGTTVGGINYTSFEYSVNGRLDEVRITNGTGRYTADYTPQTEAFPGAPGGEASLTVADTQHAHTVDALILSADMTLVAADTTHAHTIDAVALSADLNLAVADTVHAHATDNLVLESSEPNLTLAGVEHAHTIDNATLQAAMSLVVAGMEHPHTIDNITLSAALDLIVAGMEYTHTIDAVELVSGLALTVQDMTHAHTVAGLTLETALSLAIDDALHGHTLDAVALETAVTLLINDVLHAHTIDGPAIYLPTPVIEELRRSVFARVVQLRTFARLDNPQVFTRQ